MRSQQEIIDKIKMLRSSQADPMGCQVKMLVRKLHWSTAKDLIPKDKAFDPEVQKNWDRSSCLEKKFLIGEMGELMYQAYDAVIENDLKKMLMFHQIFTVFAWLLHDGTLIRELIFKLEAGEKVPVKFKKFLFKGIFDLVCTNFGLRPQVYCRDWELDQEFPPDPPAGPGNNLGEEEGENEKTN